MRQQREWARRQWRAGGQIRPGAFPGVPSSLSAALLALPPGDDDPTAPPPPAPAPATGPSSSIVPFTPRSFVRNNVRGGSECTCTMTEHTPLSDFDTTPPPPPTTTHHQAFTASFTALYHDTTLEGVAVHAARARRHAEAQRRKLERRREELLQMQALVIRYRNR